MADDIANLASPQVINRMLYLVNTERGGRELPAVEGAEVLHRAAQAHSEDMARRGYLDTLTPDGTSAEGLAARAGYPGQVVALVYSGPTSFAAVAAWMASSASAAGEDRRLLLSPHLRQVGVGLSESKWTLLLGADADAPSLAGLPATRTTTPSQSPHGPSTAVRLPPVQGPSDTVKMNLTAPTESFHSAQTAALDAAPMAPAPATPAAQAAAASPAAAAQAAQAAQSAAQAAPAQAAQAAAAAAAQAAHAAPEVPAAPAVQVPQARVSASPALVARVLAVLNGERDRWHLPPLILSEPLSRAAQEHAEDMAQRGYYALVSPDGEGLDERAVRRGYGGRCGGVLAIGPGSAEEALSFWLGDAVAQASLLNGDYVDLGIGIEHSRWALLLGLPAPKVEEPPPKSFSLGNLSLPSLSLGRAPALPQAPDPQLANRVMLLVNTERARVALHPLALSDALSQAAQAHSNDMVARDYFAYVGPDGQGVEGRVGASGYAGRSGANLCVGHSSPEAVVKFFMQQEGNKQNLLYPDYRHLGVGTAKGRWTLVFGIPEVPVSTGGGPQLLARTLDLVNGERARARLPALALSEQLCRAAQAHAEDMARRNYVGSVSPEGEDVGKRVDRAGYRWRSVTESTASDRATPEAALEAWLRTADHRANILDPDFRHLGVGVAMGRWSLVFARP